MRTMSFSLTAEQVRSQNKTVTRRIGWEFLKPGDLFQPILKGQGLKKNEKITKLGGIARTVNVRREPLCAIFSNLGDLPKEGFAHSSPADYVTLFCRANPRLKNGMRVRPTTMITRIEFTYQVEKEAVK